MIEFKPKAKKVEAKEVNSTMSAFDEDNHLIRGFMLEFIKKTNEVLKKSGSGEVYGIVVDNLDDDNDIMSHMRLLVVEKNVIEIDINF